MVEFDTFGRGGAGTINYDAATQTYTFVNNSGDTWAGPFGPADRTTSGSFDVYDSGHVLTLFNNVRSGASQTGAPVNLTYLSFGKVTADDSVDNNLLGMHQATYFVFGYPTQTSDMPTSGTATYSATVIGDSSTLQQNDPITTFTGSATLTANFGSGTVSTALTLPIAFSGSASSTYNGSGTISANEFSGTFTSSNDPFFSGGEFDGGFFGPSAREMGYTFGISRNDPASSKGLEYIVGAAAGPKTGP